MDNLPEVLTRLNTRLNELESRVALLEHPSEVSAALPPPSPLESPSPAAIASSSFAQSGATFAVIGKAMLGMAGAYLLRAVAESGSFPKLATVALAIAYAGMWLLWAARVPAREWFASTTYAVTSTLILAPMLWELTLRFKVLSPSTSATVLAAFVIASYALAWRRNLTSIVWVADLAAAITATALLIATHDLPPYLAVLLLVALLSETAACRNRWLTVRPVVALAVDLAAWMLVYIYSNPDRNPTDYANLGAAAVLTPAATLFLIYGTSVALRAVLLRQTITLFDSGQAVIAFLIAADAVLHFGSSAGLSAYGAFCLALSIAGYTTVFVLGRAAEHRNYHIFATWSLALFLLGSFLCLPNSWLASCLGIAAIVATSFGASTHRLTLAFHGLAYLGAAAFASGLMQYASHVMAGDFPELPVPIVWIIAAASVLCYAIGGQIEETHWRPQLFHTLAASLAAGSAATALVSAMVWLTATAITPGSSRIAVIRTLAACALALTLAWLGPRWRRIELVWLAYATIAAVAAKLLLEDLRQGHPEFIAASIFLFALTLLLVPQLVRRSTLKWQTIPPATK